jgi:hypothetical protein
MPLGQVGAAIIIGLIAGLCVALLVGFARKA